MFTRFAQASRAENGTDHFDVSKNNFDDFSREVSDAITFLRSNAAALRVMMSESGADTELGFVLTPHIVSLQPIHRATVDASS